MTKIENKAVYLVHIPTIIAVFLIFRGSIKDWKITDLLWLEISILKWLELLAFLFL